MIALLAAAALMIEPSALDTAKTPLVYASAVKAESTQTPVLTAVAVTVECTARANGQVDNCAILGETHPGLGFGEAAVALMNDAEVEAGSRDMQFARTIQFTP